MTSLKHSLLVAALAASLPSLAQAQPPKAGPFSPPTSWSAYFSGGPHKSGSRVTLPDGRIGVVVGDFHSIPNGSASSDNPGTFRYAVMVPGVSGDDCRFGLSVVMIESSKGGRDTIVGSGRDADPLAEQLQRRIETTRARVLASTARGREIQAEADKQLAKWNKRSDASVKKFSTREGYQSLVIDMALNGAAGKLKGGLKNTGDLDRIFKETLIDAVKNKASSDLPYSLPPFNGDQAASVELTKGNIKLMIEARMKNVKPDSRAEIMTNLLVQFAGTAIASEDGDLAEAAMDALGDVAVDLAVSRYPIVGPMAKEAVELAKQFNGYLDAMNTLDHADANFTAALNAWNESYGARQALELMQSNRGRLLQEASDLLYKEDPKLEPWLVSRLTDRLEKQRAMFAKILADMPPKAGPPAPGAPVKLGEDDGFTDIGIQWQVPMMIEGAGREDALVAVDRLNVRNRRGRSFDATPEVDAADPLRGLRTFLSGKGGGLGGLGGFPSGRNALAPDVFMPPPAPTMSEKEALERDCRLKKMAEAEREVPRIGPQVASNLKLTRTLRIIGSLNGDSPTGGLEIYRADESRPLYVIPAKNFKGRYGVER